MSIAKMQNIADRIAFTKEFIEETRRLVDQLESDEEDVDTHNIDINGTKYEGSCDIDCWCRTPGHVLWATGGPTDTTPHQTDEEDEPHYDRNIIHDRRIDAIRREGGEY